MRRSAACMMSRSAVLLDTGVSNATPWGTGATVSEEREYAALMPANSRGVKSTTLFEEPNTSIYDSTASWSYFQPMKVNIEKMGAPDAKYYQRHTRREWDISTSEWYEMTQRKKYVLTWYYAALILLFWFVIPKEKSYSGLVGCDGFWALLPKGQPELYA